MKKRSGTKSDGFTFELMSVVFIVFMVSCLVFSHRTTDLVVNINSEPKEPTMNQANISHDPITISNDTDFYSKASNEGWSGNGTIDNPIMIENYNIDLKGNEGNCIEVYNTTIHFTISACRLEGAFGGGSGVYFQNVTFGRVESCTCTNSSNGIFVNIGSNNVIVNNNCSYSGKGIYLASSDYNTICNNICVGDSGEGIYLHSRCDYNIVDSNIAIDDAKGISLFNRPTHNIISNNTCLENYYGIWAHSYCDYSQFINNTCSFNDYYGLFVAYSDYSVLIGNICNNNTEYGIHLWQSQHCEIISNNLYFNMIDGIYLYSGSYYTKIMYNNISMNNNGIAMSFDSDWCEITRNIILNNTGGGISLGSSSGNDVEVNMVSYNGVGLSCGSNYGDNDIRLNIFENNTINAIDNWQSGGSHNRFDYNYWSNYSGSDTNNDKIGDTSHPIQGQAGSSDPHPLMFWSTPPEWTELPTNQISELGTGFQYDLNATAISSIGGWWLAGDPGFAIDQNGVITNTTYLQVNDYNVEVWVNNTYGVTTTATITVAVVDTTPPEWIEPLSDQILECGFTLHYNINASDLSNATMWTVNDTAHFTISNEGIVSSVGIVPVGEYGIEVASSDPYGNTLTGTFSVIVEDNLAPVWIEQPSDAILELGETMNYSLTAWDPSGLDSWLVNDTIHFMVEGGTVTNATLLNVGQYGIRVWTNDTFGHTLSADFRITVHDTTSPKWIQAPSAQYVEFGDVFTYNLNVTDLSDINRWWLNDTERFSVDWNGRIRSYDILDIGQYGIAIYVNDTYGNTLSNTFTVIVRDTTAPILTVIVSDQVLDFGEPFNYSLAVFDISGIQQWEINNTISFNISEDGRITNITILEPGAYPLNITVSDPHGNSFSITFTVSVLEPPITTTSTTTSTSTTTTSITTSEPTTSETTTTTPLSDGTMIIVIVGIAGTLVVIILLLLNRRGTLTRGGG